MLNDVFFKALLCDDRHKELTLNFLNSILNRTGEQAFCDLEFLDKELDPIIDAGKVSILDIRAKMNDNTQVNIEVQIAKPKDMKKRAVFYWAKLYSYQISEGFRRFLRWFTQSLSCIHIKSAKAKTIHC